MNVGAISPTALPSTDGNPRNIEEAGQAFEALFISQLLKSAREGASDGEIDQTGSAMLEVAEEFFAREIAKGGGLGFAKKLLSQMPKSVEKAKDVQTLHQRSISE